MCYSAMAIQAMKDLGHIADAAVDEHEYVRILTRRAEGEPIKIPKALDDDVRDQGGEMAALVDAYRQTRANEIGDELAKQIERRDNAESKLSKKITKTAQNDLRISVDKIGKLETQLADLARTKAKARDTQIFPNTYAAIIAADQDGKRWIRPMRYGCRPAGKPAWYDEKYPGTYNARRDNLSGFWKGQFGHTHAVMVVTHFWENVDRGGCNQRVEFWPRTDEPMLVPCLWSRWVDPDGKAPELMSFAAITDDPEPEVEAVGHDRTIINLKPENLDAWLNPEGLSLQDLQAILSDTRHPYYEHRDVQ